MSNLPWKKMTPEEIKTRDKALLVLSPLVIMLIVARFGDWNKIISSLLLGFGCLYFIGACYWLWSEDRSKNVLRPQRKLQSRLPLSREAPFLDISSARLLWALLVAGLTLVVLAGVMEAFEQLPESLRRTKDALVDDVSLPHIFTLLIFALSMIISMTGLFFLRAWAAKLFIITMSLSYLTGFLDMTPTIQSAYIGAISSISDVLTGATILFLAFALQRTPGSEPEDVTKA